MPQNPVISTANSARSLESQGSSLYLYGAVLVACTGGFIFGYASFVMSGVIIFLTKEFTLTPGAVGLAISSMTIGCLIGSGIAAAISDQLGRKKAMTIAALLWAASSLGTAFAPNMAVVNLFRICGGIGVGVAMLVSPIYIAEVSPARIRGRLSTANQFITTIGALSSLLICYFLSFSASWRWAFGLGVLPAVGMLAGLLSAPESPRWLIEKNREAEALAILTKINGPGEAASSAKLIVASVSREGVGTYSELFRPGIRGALIVGIGIAAFQQLTGAGMVAYYSPVIFQKAGFSSASTAIGWSVVIFASNLFCVALAMALVDRVGRRPLMLMGTVTMGLGLAMLAVIIQFGWSPYLAVAAVIFIQAVCNVSWGPLGWVILGEIFPTHIRAKAMSIATFCLWVSMFASVQFIPSIIAYFTRVYGSGGPTFLIFAGVCVFAYIFVWRMLPETKGKTLEEIAASWAPSKS